jgi:predicted nucleotidyltransferase
MMDNDGLRYRFCLEGRMIDLLVDHLDEIAHLCRRYRVRRLDVFGSAATGAFDPGTSDVDFVVDLGEYDDDVHIRYLDLISNLEALLGFPVSMITRPSIHNPYLRVSIEEEQELVYEAGDRQAAA